MQFSFRKFRALLPSRDARLHGEVHEALSNFSVKLDKDAVRIIDGAHEAKFQWGTAYAGARGVAWDPRLGEETGDLRNSASPSLNKTIRREALNNPKAKHAARRRDSG